MLTAILLLPVAAPLMIALAIGPVRAMWRTQRNARASGSTVRIRAGVKRWLP